MIHVDTERLEREGFVVLRNLVPADDIGEFEAAVARFAEAQVRDLGLRRPGGEPFIEVFRRGGRYTERIYRLLEELFVLHRMSVRIGDGLKASGFLDWAEIAVPLIWPDIRADIPGDSDRLLPVHQDYGSMQARRAWRLWIPLRHADAHYGTMAAYPGTHARGPLPHDVSDPRHPVAEAIYYDGIAPVIFDLPAGDGVLINPLVLHASVPNRSDRTKFTLMVQVQDYATVIDPDAEDGAFADFQRINAVRKAARAAAQ